MNAFFSHFSLPRVRRAAMAATASILCTGAWAVPAEFVGHPVEADTSSLPAADPARDVNPYRGVAAAVDVGRKVYDQACASCHGANVSGYGVAPDLKRLDGFCKRMAQNDPLRDRCLGDVDAYFQRSVLYGKIKVGVMHMPPWKGHLTPEQIWAVRTYVETRPKDERNAKP